MDNFERTYLQANEIEKAMGFHWYQDQHAYIRDMAEHFNVPLDLTCGIVAVLSPMIAWNENLNMAYNILKYDGKPPAHVKYGGFKRNLHKAIKMYRTKKVYPTLSGPKVTQFYVNLFDPFDSDSVTVDTFMIACFHEEHDRRNLGKFATEKNIFVLRNTLIELAKQHNLLPCQMQATIWLTYHRIVKSMQSYGMQLRLKVF